MTASGSSGDGIWDPFGTLHGALWVGGGQRAGKSTVTRILAHRFGLTVYHYDYHDARGHEDRRVAQRARNGQPLTGPDPEETWVNTTPERMAAETLAGFRHRFDWVLDDLRALVSGRPILAEGFGLRPELVAPLLDSPRRMAVMIPTESFRQRQIRTLPRAAQLSAKVSDPARGHANRVARDRLLAQDAADSACRLGIQVIEVDGPGNTEAMAGELAAHFAPYLPPARLGLRLHRVVQQPAEHVRAEPSEQAWRERAVHQDERHPRGLG